MFSPVLTLLSGRETSSVPVAPFFIHHSRYSALSQNRPGVQQPWPQGLPQQAPPLQQQASSPTQQPSPTAQPMQQPSPTGPPRSPCITGPPGIIVTGPLPGK